MKTTFLKALTVLSIGLGQSQAMEEAEKVSSVAKNNSVVLERINFYTGENKEPFFFKNIDITYNTGIEKNTKGFTDSFIGFKYIRHLTLPKPLFVCETPELAKSLRVLGYDVVDPSISLTLNFSFYSFYGDLPSSLIDPIVIDSQTTFSLDKYFSSILNNELYLSININLDNTIDIKNMQITS